MVEEKRHQVILHAQTQLGKVYMREPKIKPALSPNASQQEQLKAQYEMMEQNSYVQKIPLVISFTTSLTLEEIGYLFNEKHPVNPDDYDMITDWQFTNGLLFDKIVVEINGELVDNYNDFVECLKESDDETGS